MQNEKTIFSDHALLRYCERVSNRDAGCDAKQYLILNRERIDKEVEKLFISSELLYTGKLGATDRQSIQLFGNKNGWVFIVDPVNGTIITLYKIDLEVDDSDFNQQYIEKAFQILKNKVDSHKRLCDELSTEISEIQKEKNNNLEEIKILKKHIKLLEESNESFDTFIRLKQSQISVSELELKKFADKFCAKDSGSNIGREKI